MLPSLYYAHRWKEILINEESKALAHALGLSPALASHLQRSFLSEEEILDFLHPKENSDMIPGTHDVAKRIHQAMEKGERILLFGDYDVDGLTSIALMKQFFDENNYPVLDFVPNRYDEGYGISFDAIEHLPPCDLLVSFDCGVSSYREVEELMKRGIDVLITDHHEPPAVLPACPVMNPKLGYSFPHLAGVGVAYKLASFLSRQFSYVLPKDAIIFAMLGTLCDLMPLRQENRWIVQRGLDAYENTQHPGLIALLEVTGDQRLDAAKVGFQLGPMLNAAGRMGDPELALQLLKGEGNSRELAEILKANNDLRKEEEKSSLQEAREKVDPHSPMILLSGPWKKGILGLVASRLSEEYRKPSIIMDEELSGSCRSVGSFSILKALEDAKEYLLRFGGHQKAAGLQVHPEHYKEFEASINAYTKRELDFLDSRKQYHFLNLEPKEVNLGLLDELRFLAPFGIANPQPVFRLMNLSFVESKELGQKGNAFLLLMKNGDRMFEFIHFDPEYASLEKGNYDVLFTVSESHFRGIVSLRLQMKDLRPSRPDLLESQLFLPFYEGLADSIAAYQGKRGEICFPVFEEDFIFQKGGSSFPVEFPHPESFQDDTAHLLQDLPEREDLVKIYTWLRRQGNSFKWRSASRPFLAMISLKIFEELELLSYTNDRSNCHYTLIDHHQKMNLDSSLTYRKIQRIKEDLHGTH